MARRAASGNDSPTGRASGLTMRVPALPPECFDLGAIDLGNGEPRAVVLRRLTIGDAEVVAAAVGDNIEHLRPWMPWANEESADERFQRRRLTEAEAQWNRGADFGYGLFANDDGPNGRNGRLLGAFGLTARRGPKTLEIGYWLCADATVHGLASRAVEVLTDAAAALPDVERLLVYCDEANHASAAIPRRLGYRVDRVVTVPAEAAAETGRQIEWVLSPDEWRALRRANAGEG
jgi:RimJ/RimL family protein N-acetyltransferase